MHIIRFLDENNRERYGVPRSNGGSDCSSGGGDDGGDDVMADRNDAIGNLATVIADPHGLLSAMPSALEGVTVRECLESGEAFILTDELARVKTILAPTMPTNVLCAGRNYHAAGEPEMGSSHPPPSLELFMKPTTAVQHPGRPIVLPVSNGQEPDVDAEGEFAVLIGATLRNATARDALDAIVGCTIAIDVTDRRWQTPTGPPVWMRGKGFDTFCTVGPALVTADELDDLLAGERDLSIRTRINGETVRDGTTRMMIRPIIELIVEISRFITILPGTLLLTGAPPLVERVGDRHRALQVGDVVEASIDGLAPLTTWCVDRASERTLSRYRP